MTAPITAPPVPASGPDEGRAADTAARLRLATGRLTRLLRRGTNGDLTASQYSALIAVVEHEPLRVTELAAVEGIAVPTATRLLDALVGRGLLERAPDPDDGRSTLVRLTPAGAELVARTRGTRTALLAERIGRLTPDQVDALERALPALEALTAER